MSGRTIGNLILMKLICRLPTDRRRNASERRVDQSSDGADGRPTIKTRDRLLKRLIAVHGEPRFDLFNSRRPTRS